MSDRTGVLAFAAGVSRIAVQSDEATTEGRTVRAQAGDRSIVLERLTSQTTRLRKSAKQGWFFRDRARAGEIIAQTEKSLDELPVVSQKSK